MTFAFLLAEFIVISGVLLGLTRFGTTPVVVVVASMQFLQAILGATLYWEFADGLLLSPGSCVFFASNVAILLYVYLIRGASDARDVFYAIVGSNLVVVALSALIFIHIEVVPPVNFLGLPHDVFNTSLSLAITGTIVLALTQLVALTLFNAIRSKWPSVPIALPMTVALTSALVFDTIGYLVPLFWSDPNLGSMLLSGVISRGAAGVAFGITWGLWAQRNRDQHTESLRRLFRVLMWADDAASFRTDTAELYRKSELDSDSPDFEQDWTEDKLRRWLTRLSYGVCVIRGETVSLANTNFAAQVGETLGEDLRGRSVTRHIPSKDFDKLCRMAHRADDQSDGAAVEIELDRSDGTTLTVEAEALSMSFEGSLAIVIMARDITEKKQLRDQVSHNERLAVVGTLTATVAHEINNPLAYLLANQNFVIGTIERLKPGASPQLTAQLDELADAAADAREGAERIRSVVDELSNFTRLESVELSPVDVAEVIDSSVNMAMPQIKHRAQLVRDVSDLPLVDVHSQRLGQVLLNLLVNAAQSIEEGAYSDHEIRVSAATEGDSVMIRITDTGNGIDPAIQHRIMEPFYTTKPVGEGTGLGLATCRSIVESFNGEMGFHSTLGEGSTFWVSLPTSPTHAPEANDDGASEPEPSDHRRILFIDDERALARACARMMKPHDVTICSSGGEALALLDQDSAFDIIFCDLMMPNITGMQLHRELVERGSKLAERMVFITGSAFLSSAQRYLEAVDLPCLNKPFDWEDVRTLIEQSPLDGAG